ncbi:hypothetical protein IEQ34_005469 [Dendrobium chrysotoxum]|uniref:Band 7 domain-containing protein n=1 Tax=Dendrobium chrysotoxum TaxID=161865 RepID=A0AAV7H9X1_DENCH|nr:hypothetical protein IEQ34_005469 [Dendrobium chrysotoxum]
MLIGIWLIALFRDRGAILTPEHFSQMGRFTCDIHGRITFRFKWLDIQTIELSKSWANGSFFVKNNWNLIEKWGNLKELSVPIHIREEDILRALKIPDVESLFYEVKSRSELLSPKIIEDFKKSLVFKSIIQDHIQQARDHIYVVEVKALQRQCIEDGFIRGFLKRIRLVQCKNGANIEGLSPSQASYDIQPHIEDDTESVLNSDSAIDVI